MGRFSTNQETVIPGRLEEANPESRDYRTHSEIPGSMLRIAPE
jgi:hypothetical protein